jgi:hypothetical protein
MFLAPADPLVPSHANFRKQLAKVLHFYHKSEQQLMPLAVMKPNQLPPDS